MSKIFFSPNRDPIRARRPVQCVGRGCNPDASGYQDAEQCHLWRLPKGAMYIAAPFGAGALADFQRNRQPHRVAEGKSTVSPIIGYTEVARLFRSGSANCLTYQPLYLPPPCHTIKSQYSLPICNETPSVSSYALLQYYISIRNIALKITSSPHFISRHVLVRNPIFPAFHPSP